MNRYLHLCVLAFLLVLWGCGGKGPVPQPLTAGTHPSQPALGTGEQRAGQQPLNLVLRHSSVTYPSHNTVEVDVLVSGTLDLKQASLRLLYHRQQLAPIRIDPGDALPANALFIFSLTAGGAAYKNATPDTGVLPIAFTVLPGEQGVTSDGVLARIELELMQPINDTEHILTVLEDSDYLIFIDHTGKPIPVEVSYEEASNE